MILYRPAALPVPQPYGRYEHTPISSRFGYGQLGALSAVIVVLGLLCGLTGAAMYAYLRKDLTLVVAGEPTKTMTFKRTVGEVLAETGIILGHDDEVSPTSTSYLRTGQTVTIRRAVPVTIDLDGKLLTIRSAAPTVGETLRRAGISLGPHDLVTPAPNSPVTADTDIRVVRPISKTVSEQIVIPNQVKSSVDASLPRGVVRVIREGRSGLRERQYKLTKARGKVVSRELVGERLARSPIDRVIIVGSKMLVTTNGRFAGREFLSMVATAYAPYCCPGVGIRSASGLQAGFGVVAVDPTIIPLGTHLYIEGYGQAIAGDTGGDIKGLRIDLGFATTREAIHYGRRAVRVYVLSGKLPKNTTANRDP